jgi:hypothetical protein
MPYGRGAEFDLRLAAEMVNRLEGVLEAISPATRNAVIGLAPAKFIDEAPPPSPFVSEVAELSG